MASIVSLSFISMDDTVTGSSSMFVSKFLTILCNNVNNSENNIVYNT